LHFAAANGHVNLCTALLDKGANIQACDFKGATALHSVAMTSHTAVLEALLRGLTAMAKRLVGAGANCGLKDEYRNTPGDKARQNGYDELTRLLKAEEAIT